MPSDLPDLVARLSIPLPPGQVIQGRDGTPAIWLSRGRPRRDLWPRLFAEHPLTGLWPLLLEGLYDHSGRPWVNGELSPAEMSSPDDHDAEKVLAELWSEVRLDPWPADPAAAPPLQDDPSEHAMACAEALMARKPNLKLGLVAAPCGADALTAAGWQGPINHVYDTAKLSAVLRSWERRFGARVFALGFADLWVSVAAPPATPEEARRVASEHLAFCPDNVLGCPGHLPAYAEKLLNNPVWSFWWD